VTAAAGVDPAAGSPAPAPAPWLATSALAAVEARRLVRHPLFLASGALAVAMFVSANAAGEGGYWMVTGPGMVTLALGTLLAVNLAALRDRRSGTAELLEPAPLGPATTTAAHLCSLIAAAGVTLALVAIQLAYTEASGATAGETPPSPIAYLNGPASVAACGAIGLTLARWLPTALPGLLAVPALFVVAGRLPERGSWSLLLAVCGLTAGLGALSLLRHGWRARTALAGVAGSCALVAGAVFDSI